MADKSRYHSAKNPQANITNQKRVDEDSPTKLSATSFDQIFNTSLFSRMVSVVDDIKMSRLRDIFFGAESGQLGELFDLYMKIEASDARLQSLSNSRRMAATRASHVLTVPDESNQTAQDARQLVENNIKRLNWEKFLRALLDGRMFGATVFENIWKEIGGELYIAEVQQIDHTRLEQWKLNQNDPRFGQLAILTDQFGSQRQFISEFPDYKLIVGTNTAKTGTYELAGVFRSVARWYVLKTFAVKAWAQYAEVYGFPVPTITVAKSDYQENKSLMKKLLTSVGVNRFGIFFEGMDYDLHQAADQASIDVFQKYIDLCNTEMAIAILGQNLTTEVQGGSRAAAQTHLNVLENIIQDDVDWIDEIIQSQFVDPIVRVNYPSLPIDQYPTYTSVLDKNVDLQKLGMGLQSMSRLIEIPVNFIHQISQIPRPEEDEDTVGGFGSGGSGVIEALNAQTN